MGLREKRELFARLLAHLVQHVFSCPGYTCTIGQVQRTEFEALQFAKQGLGIKRSVHLDGLAVDLNLYYRDPKTGLVKYLTDTEEHRWLGNWWMRQNDLCRWGGDFPKPDGNHYSLEHEGRA